MKKVLFFLESLGAGGAEKVLSDIVSHINSKKFDVTVYTVTNGGKYQDVVMQYSKYHSFLNVKDYESGGIRKSIYRFLTWIIYHFPSQFVYRLFIHGTYDVEVAFIEGFATKIISASPNHISHKIAWVHTDFKNNNYADRYYKDKNEQRSCYDTFREICCVSDSVKNSFAGYLGDLDSLSICYNPIDADNIRRLSKEPLEMMINTTLQLCSVGRLEHQKGFERLIKVVASVKKKQITDFSLWIIGEGSLHDKLQKLISELHVEDNVKLLGFKENPYKYVKAADAFICASYAEGFSTAATEAIILGKPVFTTACSGMYELLGNNNCGVIIENTDIGLFEMLTNILEKKYDLKNMSKAAIERSKLFDLSTRINHIENLLDE